MASKFLRRSLYSSRVRGSGILLLGPTLMLAGAGLEEKAGSHRLGPRDHVIVEAEVAASAAHPGGFAIVADPGARADQAVVAPDSKGAEAAGRLEVAFATAEESDVFLWVRARLARGSRPILMAAMDGETPREWWDHTVFPPLARNRWLWHYVRAYRLGRGAHTLALSQFAPGLGIDAIAVSTNGAFAGKLSHRGCLFIEAAASAAAGRGVFEFDVHGDLDATLWATTRAGGASGPLELPGLKPPVAGMAPLRQGARTWWPLGRMPLASGHHRLTMGAPAGVETLAVCAQPEFRPGEDPYFTGAVRFTEVGIKPDREFKFLRGYGVEHVPGFRPPASPVARSPYGGRTDVRGRKSGWFHVEQLDGRWILVDPDGCAFFNLSVNHFGADRVLKPKREAKFKTETAWANHTADWLRAQGFNSVGYQEGVNTPTYELQLERPIPYFVNGGFMMFFARSKGFQAGAGNQGFPGDCIMPFHPDYPRFCDEYARKLTAPCRTDPYLIGYYLDNELPLPEDALVKLLALPAEDAGYRAAAEWLAQRGVTAKPGARYSAEVLGEFFDFMFETYLRITIAAIRRHDPHHLICGVRANGQTAFHERFWRVIGRYTQVNSFNLYMNWTPDPNLLAKWLEWSGRPTIISEWYAKGMDTRFENVKNAGWVVRTQRDRGAFYENFALVLMQHPAIAGFNWFRVYDDNRNNVNKGLLDDSFEEYRDLMDAVRRVNRHAYELLDHLKARPLDTSFAAKSY